MANTTRKNASTVHGTNPQYIVEKITRNKVYECLYWKQHCFALTAELLVDKAIDLKYVCGTYGGLRKPSPFVCLILKMLQIQPSKNIILEFIKQKDYKYIRVLGAFYLRLTANALDMYRYLEPLYSDYRKIVVRKLDGSYVLTHVDELIDQFLHEDFVFQTSLPHLTKRHILEENEELKPRVSLLTEIDKDLKKHKEAAQDAMDKGEASEDDEMNDPRERSEERSSSRSRSRSRSRSNS